MLTQGIPRVVYGAANEKFGGVAFDPNVSKLPPRPFQTLGRCPIS